MGEISVILKSNLLITIDEFKALNRYSYLGKNWLLKYKPKSHLSPKITHRVVEYIFDEESLTMFSIISNNILVYWHTSCTQNLGYNDEYQLTDDIFIQPYRRA